ncbi:NAD(P)-dependent oxidoreductase, partial [Falsirhodobacter sp. alg1]
MGGVGRRVAQLAEAFGMPVSYCSRTAKDTPNWAFVSDLETLAAQVDVLVLTVPGGPETHHAVNEAV